MIINETLMEKKFVVSWGILTSIDAMACHQWMFMMSATHSANVLMILLMNIDGAIPT